MRVYAVRTLQLLAILAAVAVVSGCKAKQPIAPPVPPNAPTYQHLAALHNERAAKLKQFYAVGVIELRWRDDKGKSHFEQGNLELWIDQPRRTALRVEKVGKVFLWLGSDDERYWLFNMLSDDSVLHVGRHDRVDDPNAVALSDRPLTLLDLMGIAPIPADDSTAVVEYINDREAWRVQTQGTSGPVRIYFDRQSLLPVGVEWIRPTGEVALSSTLRRYQSVTQIGVSILDFPKVAALIDITVAAPAKRDSPQFTGEVKVAIDSATGVVDETQLQRVFDLDRLTQALRPARIEE